MALSAARYKSSFAVLFVLCVFSWANSCYATIVRHILRPNDSVFSVQTQHACGTYLLQSSPHWCNPALFAFAHEAAIKGDIAISANQDAYETTSKLVHEPIERPFVEKLFKEQDFQSFSGIARLEALSSYLSFAYIPGYVAGAYKLSNPNLPEVAATGLKESGFILTTGTSLYAAGDWEFYGGASLSLYDRKVYYVNANALELVVRDIHSLIEEEHKQGVNSDAGIFVQDKAGRWPNFSLVGENIFTPQAASIGQDRPLALEPNLNRIVRVGSGYTFNHVSGSYFLGVQIPYWDAFRELDRYGASIAMIYGIGRLRTFASYSQLMSTFGFLFMSSHYHVGIQYTSDKQDNSLELNRRKNVYLFVSFNF